MIYHFKVISIFSLIVTLCNKSNGQHPVKTPVEQVSHKQARIIVPNLPPTHYQFWLKNHPRAFAAFEQICSKAAHPLELIDLEYFKSLHSNLTFEDPLYLSNLNYGKTILNKICKKIDIVSKSCWGYENNCQIIHLMPECYGSKLSQAKSEQEQKIAWFSQADFGYILDRRRELNRFCSPDKYSNDTVKSSLECTKHFKTCRGENLFMKFNNIPKGSSLVTNSKQNLMKAGDVGGWNCDLQLKRIKEENGQRGQLQSWFTELENYNLIQGAIPKDVCDITIERQAFIIKLDSPSNMYHYFCNFLNLYATLHLNNKFSDDVEIVIWDNHFPRSQYNKMWSVFSRNKPISIDHYNGKRVCFKKFIFTLMPRMIDGLYYNTPLVPGCSKTGLFDAFNKHVLHKLNIKQEYDLGLHNQSDNKLVRVTMLSRSTPHRRVLNEKQLEQALSNKSSDFRVQLVDYEKMNFDDQLRITQNTDILVGLHGAGLTHTLFLPDWAALFEIHDCGDKCYSDLARLRGVNHFTYQNEEKFLKKVSVEDEAELRRITELKLADHEKFSNYVVNVDEFLNDIEKAVARVRKNRLKFFRDLEEELSKEGLITGTDTPKSQPQPIQMQSQEPTLEQLRTPFQEELKTQQPEQPQQQVPRQQPRLQQPEPQQQQQPQPPLQRIVDNQQPQQENDQQVHRFIQPQQHQNQEPQPPQQLQPQLIPPSEPHIQSNDLNEKFSSNILKSKINDIHQDNRRKSNGKLVTTEPNNLNYPPHNTREEL